jgi:hypothetical protein
MPKNFSLPTAATLGVLLAFAAGPVALADVPGYVFGDFDQNPSASAPVVAAGPSTEGEIAAANQRADQALETAQEAIREAQQAKQQPMQQAMRR